MANKKATQKTPQKKTDIQKRELIHEDQQRLDAYNARAKKQPVVALCLTFSYKCQGLVNV